MWNLFPPAKDRELIQIVDSAVAETARRSGQWLHWHSRKYDHRFLSGTLNRSGCRRQFPSRIWIEE